MGHGKVLFKRSETQLKFNPLCQGGIGLRQRDSVDQHDFAARQLSRDQLTAFLGRAKVWARNASNASLARPSRAALERQS